MKIDDAKMAEIISMLICSTYENMSILSMTIAVSKHIRLKVGSTPVSFRSSETQNVSYQYKIFQLDLDNPVHVKVAAIMPLEDDYAIVNIYNKRIFVLSGSRGDALLFSKIFGVNVMSITASPNFLLGFNQIYNIIADVNNLLM